MFFIGYKYTLKLRRKRRSGIAALTRIVNRPLQNINTVLIPEMQEVDKNPVFRELVAPASVHIDHPHADNPDNAATLDLCMMMALDLGPDVFVRQSRALQNRPDQCQSLRNIRVPTLILHGEQDQLCPKERHELMNALIPNATLRVIADAGHLPTLEQPAATNAALIEWLEN